MIVAGDLYGLLGLVLAIPALAVQKVFVRFFDELYLRSDLYLAPAASSSGHVEHQSTMRQAALAATTKQSPGLKDGVLSHSGSFKLKKQ